MGPYILFIAFSPFYFGVLWLIYGWQGFIITVMVEHQIGL
jgi:hypothetical protein